MPDWDQSRFDRLLLEYLQRSARTLADAINKKLYYVARKAIWFTAKSDPNKIRSELEANEATTLRLLKSGRYSKAKSNRTYYFGSSKNPQVPRLAKIINARRRAAGQPGLEGEEMRAAMLRVLAARLRSTAFVKSGWIPGRDDLKTKFTGGTKGLPPNEPGSTGGPKVVGAPKGGARPAVNGFRPVGMIWNAVTESKHGHPADIEKVGAAGLQRAFDDEAADMAAFLDGEMKPDAERFNRSQG